MHPDRQPSRKLGSPLDYGLKSAGNQPIIANTKLEEFNEIPIKELRTDALTELNLQRKDIGVVGGMVVAGLLPVAASLTAADLRYNSLDDSAKQRLRHAVNDRAGFQLQL